MQNDPNDLSFKEALRRRQFEQDVDEEAERLVAEAAKTPVVDEAPPYLLLPSNLSDEALNDPTYPWPEGEEPTPAQRKKRRGPVLTELQQMQLVVWQVSGFSYKESQPWMLKEWGFTVTYRTWVYYQNTRKDLHKTAAQWVTEQYGKFGYGSPIVRAARLAAHADLLQKYIRERGLYETEVHIVGGGKNERRVTAEKFNKDLSAEYRATMKQIEQIFTGPEKAAGTNAPVVQLDPATAQRFLEAAKWAPEEKKKSEE